MMFKFDFICFTSSSLFIFDVRHLHRLCDRRHLHWLCDRRLRLHRDSFRRRPCYGRLCYCWIARSFHYLHRQILHRERQNLVVTTRSYYRLDS